MYKIKKNIQRGSGKGEEWDWIFVAAIIALSPLFLFPRMDFAWVFLIVPLILVLKWSRQSYFLRRTLLDWGIFLLLFQIFITCWVVPDLWFSLPKITGILFGICTFYSLQPVLTREKWLKGGMVGFWVLGFLFTIFGVLGIGKFFTEHYLGKVNNFLYLFLLKVLPKYNWRLPGAEEGFNPNAVAGTLTLIFPVSVVFIFVYLRKRRDFYIGPKPGTVLGVLSLMVLIMGVVIYMSQSVGSWIGIGYSLILAFTFLKVKKRIFVVVLLIILLGTSFFLNSLISIRADSSITKRGILEKKSIIRMAFWSVGLEAVKEKPLTGIGLNMLRRSGAIRYEQSHAHNHLIHTGAELGIPGLAAYLAILVGAGFMCVEMWRRGKVGWIRMSALGLGAGQLAHFIWGMGDTLTLGGKPGIVFWLSLVLITGIYNFTFFGDKKR